MLTLNHTYQNNEQLQEWLIEHKFSEEKNCLVQFFSGVPKESSMNNIAMLLHSELPNAHIIGTSTDGEISNTDISTNEIIISISTFKKTSIESAYAIYEDDSFSMGSQISSKLDSDETKAMILFTTGLNINGEQFLNGIKAEAKSDFIIAGGMAGDNAKFKSTFVSHNGIVLQNGAVGIILKGDNIEASNSYEFNWNPIGLPMKVTKSELNRVYTIDGIPVVDIYKKYLTEDVASNLPKIGIEFPLIIQNKKQMIARACIKKFDDGSLLFAGNIKEGDYIRFGIASSEVFSKLNEQSKEFLTSKSIFIYSCMARRRLLKEYSNQEFKNISKHTNISGFFSYGEFFSDGSDTHLFNQTMTILSLRETDDEQTDQFGPNYIENQSLDNRYSTTKILTHMVNVFSTEWQDKLDYKLNKIKQRDEQMMQHSKLIQMGEMLSMIAHQWRQPLNAISATSINLSLLSTMGKLGEEKVEQSSIFIQEQCQKMSSTIDTFLNFVKPSKESKIFLLSNSLENVMQIMSVQLLNKNIITKIEKEKANITTIGHQDLLEQVIINIISNATDAFEIMNIEDRIIKIAIYTKDGFPAIDIQDNAGGIPSEIVDKIFNPYFTTKEHDSGTGIGLYMSMDIMKKSFKGNLEYIPVEDGSCFHITFKKSSDG